MGAPTLSPVVGLVLCGDIPMCMNGCSVEALDVVTRYRECEGKRHVHSNINSTSLGSIQPRHNLCAMTTHLSTSITVYTQILKLHEVRKHYLDALCKEDKYAEIVPQQLCP